MDGKGRWMDNRFVERLWRSLKYEAVYLEEIAGGHHARRLVGSWFDHYNHRRPHHTEDLLQLVPRHVDPALDELASFTAEVQSYYARAQPLCYHC